MEPTTITKPAHDSDCNLPRAAIDQPFDWQAALAALTAADGTLNIANCRYRCESTGDAVMEYAVTMPSLGADMDEGKLLEWHIKPGDVISKGQLIAAVVLALQSNPAMNGYYENGAFVRKTPIVDSDGGVRAGFVLDTTLAADHRVSDGLLDYVASNAP